MSDPGEAIVELLRAITTDATETRGQLLRIEQRLVELGESMRTTFAVAVHAEHSTDRTVEAIAALEGAVEALKLRIEALELRH